MKIDTKRKSLPVSKQVSGSKIRVNDINNMTKATLYINFLASKFDELNVNGKEYFIYH